MFYLNLDLSEVVDLVDQLQSRAEKAMKRAAEDLTLAVHGHILQLAQTKLRSRRETYEDSLKFNQVNESTWVIELDPNSLWIEDGKPAGEQIDALLNDAPKKYGRKKLQGMPSGKTHTAKDGSKYRVIPFEHNRGPTTQTPAATALTDQIKSEMKKRKLPYGKLEMNEQGQPKLGLLHSFNIANGPMKTHEGPGQGKGPVGAPRQSGAGIPFLQGVRVYQRKVVDKNGKASVKKGILTFRIVSSKMKGSGRWVTPGLDAVHFFEEAFDWALNEWEQKIAPQVIRDLAED